LWLVMTLMVTMMICYLMMAAYSLCLAPPLVAADVLSGLRGIYRLDGFRGFFRGNLTNCIKAVPENALKMLSFDLLKSALSSPQGTIAPRDRFLAGGAAAVIAQLAVGSS
jgi:hypothetical protein